MAIRLDLRGGFQDVREHVGHQIVCVQYRMRLGTEPANVAIECETCGVVLIDFDNPDGVDVQSPVDLPGP